MHKICTTTIDSNNNNNNIGQQRSSRDNLLENEQRLASNTQLFEQWNNDTKLQEELDEVFHELVSSGPDGPHANHNHAHPTHGLIYEPARSDMDQPHQRRWLWAKWKQGLGLGAGTPGVGLGESTSPPLPLSSANYVLLCRILAAQHEVAQLREMTRRLDLVPSGST